jgi:hypothetical protein
MLPPASKVIGVHLNYPSRAVERGRTPDYDAMRDAKEVTDDELREESEHDQGRDRAAGHPV